HALALAAIGELLDLHGHRFCREAEPRRRGQGSQRGSRQKKLATSDLSGRYGVHVASLSLSCITALQRVRSAAGAHFLVRARRFRPFYPRNRPMAGLQSGLNFRHLRCLRTAGCGVSLGWAFVNRVLERIFAVGVVFLAMGGCATRPTDTTTLSKA